jgi:hypothetical protein
MAVILVDLGDDDHDLFINNAYWRKTQDLLAPFGIVPRERLEWVWGGQHITTEEAHAIGNCLITEPLSTVNWISKVFPPPDYFRKRGLSHRDYDEGTQWLAWLRAFAGFCLTCNGFKIW